MKHIKRNTKHILQWTGVGVVAAILTYIFRKKKLETQTIVAGTRG